MEAGLQRESAVGALRYRGRSNGDERPGGEESRQSERTGGEVGGLGGARERGPVGDVARQSAMSARHLQPHVDAMRGMPLFAQRLLILVQNLSFAKSRF